MVGQDTRLVHARGEEDSRQILPYNLTDTRLSHIDARRFSIDSFYRARNLNWCLNQNDLLRRRGDADKVYEEHKYQSIIHFIISTDILLDIEHDDLLTSMLGRRIQRDLMKISEENRQ